MFGYAASYFGDPDAQYRLGRMYLDGNGALKEPKQAARWLSLAARKGQPTLLEGEPGVSAPGASAPGFFNLQFAIYFTPGFLIGLLIGTTSLAILGPALTVLALIVSAAELLLNRLAPIPRVPPSQWMRQRN